MLVCGIFLDDGIAQLAIAAADADGCPRGLVLGTVLVESGGNPRAGYGSGTVGLLQLEQVGGQGAGYTQDQLADPNTNLSIGVPYLARAWQQYAPDIWSVLQHSGHPGYPAGSVAYLWTSTPRPDLAGMTAVDFVTCAVQQVAPPQNAPAPVPPPPAQESYWPGGYIYTATGPVYVPAGTPEAFLADIVSAHGGLVAPPVAGESGGGGGLLIVGGLVALGWLAWRRSERARV